MWCTVLSERCTLFDLYTVAKYSMCMCLSFNSCSCTCETR